MNKFLLALPLAFTVAACGGTTTNANRVTVSSPLANDALAARAGVLSDQYLEDYQNGNFTQNTPTSGEASMSGAVLIGSQSIVDGENLNNPNAIGQIDVSVDFAANEVDGIASNFHFGSGVDINGELILDADILRDGNSGIAGTLGGTLNDEVNGDAVVAFDVEGNFMGANASGIVASGLGTATFGSDVENVGVVFAAD